MSWSYSRALVVEFLDQCSSDTELSAQLNTTPMPDQFYWPDKTTEHSRLSRFGMMCVPLTESLGEELLIAYQEASRARTLAVLEMEQESTVKDQDSGQKWRGSFVKYDQDTHSWKTHQCSLLGGLDEFLETWPRWGLMRNGECWVLDTLERPILEKESGFWPTPSGVKGRGHCAGVISEWGGSQNPFRGTELRNLHLPSFEEWMMGWPVMWAELMPYETDKFQSWQQQHSKYFHGPEPLEKIVR